MLSDTSLDTLIDTSHATISDTSLDTLISHVTISDTSLDTLQLVIISRVMLQLVIHL